MSYMDNDLGDDTIATCITMALIATAVVITMTSESALSKQEAFSHRVKTEMNVGTKAFNYAVDATVKGDCYASLATSDAQRTCKLITSDLGKDRPEHLTPTQFHKAKRMFENNKLFGGP